MVLIAQDNRIKNNTDVMRGLPKNVSEANATREILYLELRIRHTKHGVYRGVVEYWQNQAIRLNRSENV